MRIRGALLAKKVAEEFFVVKEGAIAPSLPPISATGTAQETPIHHSWTPDDMLRKYLDSTYCLPLLACC